MTWFDRFVDYAFFVPTARDDVRAYLAGLPKPKDKSEIEIAFEHMNYVDQKSAALLSHVSIIIAVVSISYSFPNSDSSGNRFTLLLLVAYILIAVSLLRCISLRNTIGDLDTTRCGGAIDASAYADHCVNEACGRSIVFVRCRLAVVILTGIFIVLLLYHGLGRHEGSLKPSPSVAIETPSDKTVGSYFFPQGEKEKSPYVASAEIPSR